MHKIGLDMFPSAEMRNALAQVGVEVLGVKDSGAYIGLVTDTLTGKTNGEITSGEDILVEGDKLRIAPEDETGNGIFFISAGGTSYPVTRRLTQNDPKKLLVRVPELPAGEYTLRVITRFSNNNTFVKEARVIEYGKKLVIP